MMLSASLQPAEALSQGPLQLLGGLTKPDASLPAGFLEDLISRIEPDDLPDLMVKLSKPSDTIINCLRCCLLRHLQHALFCCALQHSQSCSALRFYFATIG